MRTTRRTVLRGAAGAALTLPFLEGLSGRRAAADDATPPFAVFFRQANGVATAWTDLEGYGVEPERFWPRSAGTLTPGNVEGRALDELTAYLPRLLVIGGVNMYPFPYGEAHARGALGLLTGQGAVIPDAGEASVPAGESLDHRIGRELNPDGRDSLFLQAGPGVGMGGPCISWRGPGQRRSALRDPANAYLAVVRDAEDDGALEEQLFARGRSVNDLVRGQMDRLLRRRELSERDRRRLQVHREAIRDLETQLLCQRNVDLEAALDGGDAAHDAQDGDEVLRATRLHMDVAVIALACGLTRSVAIQVGDGIDGETHYRTLDTGAPMPNFHYVSHRRTSHDLTGEIIAGSDLLHHHVDRQFARTFRHLLDRLSAVETATGTDLLEAGFAAWMNDLGYGAAHTTTNMPVVVAGSAGGQLVQGRYVRLTDNPGDATHPMLLNTFGAAVGLTNDRGEPLDDFGDERYAGGRLPPLLRG
ncbi:MAG: DUF1552 domain-containing protein [Sandaracinaceae bacterium]